MHAAEEGDILWDQDLQDAFGDYDEEEEFEVDFDLDGTDNQFDVPPPPARMSSHRPPGRGAGGGGRTAARGLTSPPGRGRTATPRRAAAAAGGDDPPQDDMEGLAQGMSNVQLTTPTRFVAFSFDTVVPFRVVQTPLINDERTCLVDFFVHNVFQDKHAISLSTNGIGLSLLTQTLKKFVRPTLAAIGEQFAIQGDRDSVVSGYEEVEDQIVEAHGQGPYQSGTPQVVVLPFACQQNFELDLVWCEGDDELMAWCDGEGLPPQLMPVLRVVLKSLKKSRSRVGFTSRALASAPRMPPPAPPAGGYGGGGGGSYGGGGGGYGGGGGGDGFGGDGFGGGDDDGDAHNWRRVPGGLVAEALRRSARFAHRAEAERSGGHSHSAGMTAEVTSSSAPVKSDGDYVPATAAVTPNKTEAV